MDGSVGATTSGTEKLSQETVSGRMIFIVSMFLTQLFAILEIQTKLFVFRRMDGGQVRGKLWRRNLLMAQKTLAGSRLFWEARLFVELKYLGLNGAEKSLTKIQKRRILIMMMMRLRLLFGLKKGLNYF